MTDRVCAMCPAALPETAGRDRMYCNACQVRAKRARERRDRDRNRAALSDIPVKRGACKVCRTFCRNDVMVCVQAASDLVLRMRPVWDSCDFLSLNG